MVSSHLNAQDRQQRRIHEEGNANKWHIRAQKPSPTCQYMDIYLCFCGVIAIYHYMVTDGYTTNQDLIILLSQHDHQQQEL